MRLRALRSGRVAVCWRASAARVDVRRRAALGAGARRQPPRLWPRRVQSAVANRLPRDPAGPARRCPVRRRRDDRRGEWRAAQRAYRSPVAPAGPNIVVAPGTIVRDWRLGNLVVIDVAGAGSCGRRQASTAAAGRRRSRHRQTRRRQRCHRRPPSPRRRHRPPGSAAPETTKPAATARRLRPHRRPAPAEPATPDPMPASAQVPTAEPCPRLTAAPPGQAAAGGRILRRSRQGRGRTCRAGQCAGRRRGVPSRQRGADRVRSAAQHRPVTAARRSDVRRRNRADAANRDRDPPAARPDDGAVAVAHPRRLAHCRRAARADAAADPGRLSPTIASFCAPPTRAR